MEHEILEFVADKFIFLLGGTIVLTAIFAGTAKDIIRIRSRERSRREIAAYIAEGTMSPEQGERLMKASEPGRLC